MEKENKYYGIIENLVRTHKKFPGLEPILEDIIDDVYSHSEVILNSVSNETVITAYLSKVVSTSVITVPKKMNFHTELKHRVISPSAVQETQQEETYKKADTRLVDKMINSSIKEDVPTVESNVAPSTIEKEQNLIEEINLNAFDTETEEEPLVIDDVIEEPDKAVVMEIADEAETIELNEEPQEELSFEVEDTQADEVLETVELDEEPQEDLSLEVEDTPTDEVLETVELDEEPQEDLSLEVEDTQVEEVLETVELDQEPQEELSFEVEDTQADEVLETVELDEEPHEELSFEVEDTPTDEVLETVELDEEPQEDLSLEVEDTQVEEVLETVELDQEPQEYLSLEESPDDEIIQTSDNALEEFTQQSADEDFLIEDETQSDLSLDEEMSEFQDVTEDSSLESFDNIDVSLDTVLDNDLDDITPLDESSELTDDNTEKDSNEVVNFVPTDYSKFEFTPEDKEIEDRFDVEMITKEIKELAEKKPELSITEIYNLKYKDCMSVSEISSKLDISENRVIEALNEIIAVL